MALFVLYQINTTDRTGANVTVQLLRDQASAPASVLKLPLSNGGNVINYGTSTGDGRGVISYYAQIRLFASSTLRNLFTGDDILELRIDRGADRIFTGKYNFNSLREEVAPGDTKLIEVTFSDGMSRLKNISTLRYPFAGGPVTTLYAFIFETMLATAGYPFKGILSHPWKSGAWVPSGVNIKQQFLEMSINYDLFAGQTYSQIMQTLCTSFDFAIGYSLSQKDVILCHLPAGRTGSAFDAQRIDGSSITDLSITPPGFTALTLPSTLTRLRRLGRIAVNVPGDPPNLVIETTGVLGYNYGEFNYETPFDSRFTAIAQDNGIQVRGSGGTQVAAGDFVNVNPSDDTELFAFDEAVTFSIAQVRGKDNSAIEGAFLGMIDPAIPFRYDSKTFRIVTGSYDFLDAVTDLTKAVEI